MPSEPILTPARTLTPRYVALLAGVAVVILIGGALLRPHHDAPSAPPPTEVISLQERSQERGLADLGSFLDRRAATVAAHVVAIAWRGQTGLAWAPDTVLAAGAAPGIESDVPVTALAIAKRDSVRPIPRDSVAGPGTGSGWAVAVARRPDGRVLSLSGMYGSRVAARCGSVGYQEIVFDAPLHPAFLGGGLFGLDGRGLGFIGSCAGRPTIVALTDVPRLLRLQQTPEYRLITESGLAVTRLDSLARTYFGADSGVLVTQVRSGSPADRAGLLPGDVLRTLDGVTVTGPAELATALAPHRPGTLPVALRRTATGIALVTRPDSVTPAVAGVVVAGARGLLLTGVVPGSAAERAGLRAGDRIVRLGRDRRTPTAAALTRALTALAAPLWIAYERDGRLRGVLLVP